jgi:hypothetical protein
VVVVTKLSNKLQEFIFLTPGTILKLCNMASLKISIPHQLSQEEALARIQSLFMRLKEEKKDKMSGIKEEWQGNTGRFGFTVQGFDLSGTILVQSSAVDIDADLPFALSFFKGKIKEIIEEKAKAILG